MTPRIAAASTEMNGTRSLPYQCSYQVWLKSIDIYSSYRPEPKIRTMLNREIRVCFCAINYFYPLLLFQPTVSKRSFCCRSVLFVRLLFNTWRLYCSYLFLVSPFGAREDYDS